MENKVTITPLNCAFGTGLNSILTMDEAEYVAATGRKIYCKNPDVSWFKMKSTTDTPYLEPAFYGLNKGDIVTVEFDAVLLSGSASLDFRMIKVNSNYSTEDPGATLSPIGSLKTFYKHFKSRMFVDKDGIGILINLRPNGSNNELIIKNIEITIETSNPLFSIGNNIVAYKTKTDFMKCIDFYSGTNLNTTYHGILDLYTEGKISFPDNETIMFSNAGFSKFKGLMALLNGNVYRASIAVYLEYISPSDIYITSKSVGEDGTFTQDASTIIGSKNILTKKMVYLIGWKIGRKTFVDVGFVSNGQELTLKNVRFSMPQFDDSVKRPPNQLEELYTNLHSKLR